MVDEWNAIPQQRVKRLISSVRRRYEAVVAAFGGFTRYYPAKKFPIITSFSASFLFISSSVK